MPRSNRPRRRDGRRDDQEDTGLDRLLSGWKRTETRRGREFAVQPVTAASAQKEYRCPGCDGVIPLGTAHLVVWQVDGVLGDAADLAARRHWHDHCWRIG